jgi:transmembrane sensor
MGEKGKLLPLPYMNSAEENTTYEHYDVADFVIDPGFAAWVESPDEQKNDFWNAWIRNHPSKEIVVKEAAALIRLLRAPVMEPAIDPSFINNLKERIDTTISFSAEQQEVPKRWYLKPAFKIAASVFVVLLCSLSYFLLRPSEQVSYATAYGAIKSLTLPDGSEVILNANSSLSHSKNWNSKKREIWLKGEGIFKVKHIEDHNKPTPFIVHCESGMTEVLGTTFSLKNRNNTTSIVLKEGKVRFTANDKQQKPVLLAPGQQMYYNSHTGSMEKKEVNAAAAMSWAEYKLIFDHTPLDQVCARLKEYFGITFILKGQTLSKVPVTGTLSTRNKQGMLHTLSVLLNTPVKEVNGTVLIGEE